MKKKFNTRVWRGYYDQINILGQYLKDSLPDWLGNPPKFKITHKERVKAEKEINLLLRLCDDYLDKCFI